MKYVPSPSEWGSATVKGLIFLPYLQANKLSNYSFMLIENMRLLDQRLLKERLLLQQ